MQKPKHFDPLDPDAVDDGKDAHQRLAERAKYYAWLRAGYRKKSNYFSAAYLISMFLLVALMLSHYGEENIWDQPNYVAIVLVAINGLSFLLSVYYNNKKW